MLRREDEGRKGRGERRCVPSIRFQQAATKSSVLVALPMLGLRYSAFVVAWPIPRCRSGKSKRVAARAGTVNEPREAEKQRGGRRALRGRVLHALRARSKYSPAAVGTNDFGILAIRITRLVSYARLRLSTPKEYFRADRIAASFQVELGNARL